MTMYFIRKSRKDIRESQTRKQKQTVSFDELCSFRRVVVHFDPHTSQLNPVFVLWKTVGICPARNPIYQPLQGTQISTTLSLSPVLESVI
jgi:hypothetical protein